MIQQRLVFPTTGIKVEIHHQLAKFEQAKRSEAMNLPVRFDLQHRFDNTLEILLRRAVVGYAWERDSKIDTKLFSQ
ncbi:hypothetical protein D3C71_1626890 [compost metagenome]